MQPDRAKVPLIGSDEVLQLIPRMFAQRIQQKCFTRCRNDVIDRVPRGARTISEGGFHPDNCRLVRKLAGGTAG